MSSCPEYEHFAEFYDHVDLYRQRPDLAFYLDLARASAGRVLEVGCGTGRLLLPIARAGVAIDGLDSAPAMLDLCREALAREPADVQARVRLYAGDMCDPPIDERYALVTIPFRAFLHLLTVDDQLRALTALRERLQPGGRLVLDVFNPSLPMLTDQRITIDPVVEPAFTMPDGRRIVRSWRIVSRDYFEQTQLVEFAFEATDREGHVTVQREQFSLRFMFRYEAEHLLERCGFRVDAVYADYDRRPVGTIYPGDLVFVATRR